MLLVPTTWKRLGEPVAERVAADERAAAAALTLAIRPHVRIARTPIERRGRLNSFVARLYSFHPIPMRTLIPLDRAMFTFLGLEISGDLGDFTMWRTRRGKIVCYPRTVPGEPASAAQQVHRQHFRESLARWNLLTADQKADYETASLRLSLPMTGHNLWVRWTFAGSLGEVRTIERLAGVTLVLPPEILT